MTIKSIQTQSGKFTISAFDQRSSLMKMLKVDGESEVGRKRLEDLKSIFMETFSPISSAVLVDPDFGLPSLSKKAGTAGLLMSLESFDYNQDDPSKTPILKESWGVKEIAEKNACVKLFFYYNPKSTESVKQHSLVESLFNQSKQYHVPFLLEPILYPIENQKDVFEKEYFELQKQMVRDFTPLCDVLKLEFPVVSGGHINEKEDEKKCYEISSLSTVPWVMLSRGVSYDRYVETLKIAMRQGASGIAVGRAVWKEIGNIESVEDQYKYIRTIGKERLLRLIDIVES